MEGNHGMWAFNITNQFSYYFNDRISINPSLTYFGSLADVDIMYRDEEETQDYASSLFTDVKIQADILRSPKDFRIGLAVGPSFQFGGTSYHRGFTMDIDKNMVSMGYEVEKHKRLGYVTELIIDWPHARSNRRSSAAVSMSSFSGYWPYYLMVTYRLGFQLK